ncbi:phosphoglycerate mutase family protein [Vagococcus intermedius]|uniref:Histidine phosphatase family protein n=1 Tax=Vagococcus intermedius TaxID=2991418 RepID=A0AAF0CT47_9ENTE|nr:phosphoglycerate mutase family protein [Vagococcus intermedius]WEG72458.1 histidine phosphatase family protein [Vagococcus intermedius]WEG74545.1 histidine phosphatase family protein [Vagococcus intermedius]
MKIITVQHPEAVNNYNHQVESLIDWDLTDTGKEQANKIAENLLKELGDEEIVLYTSDLLRAKNTTAALNNLLNIVKVGYEKGLRTNISDKNIVDSAWDQLVPFYQKVLTFEYKTIIIVSHGEILSLFHAMFLDRELHGLKEATFSGVEGGVSFLEITETGQHIIHKINDLSYLI